MSPRPRLLIFFAPADHPHRDAVCATLSWLAAAEGRLFECYYDGVPSGVHFGGGLPWRVDPADLRGGTFIGGRHVEQFEILLDRFECQAACLGGTIFSPLLSAAEVPLRAKSDDVVEFYRQLFTDSSVEWPDTLCVVGRGEDAVSAIPYACQEIAHRRVLGIADGDVGAVEGLSPGMTVEHLWSSDGPPRGSESSVEYRSLAMASRWHESTRGYLLGDPELIGRWIPTAVRKGWAPVYGIPQVNIVNQLSPQLETVPVVWGRQQDDADFLALSKAGVAFQLIDPGRPPFPVISESTRDGIRAAQRSPEPPDDELSRWAEEGRVVSTVIFWAGMVRELECFYALAEILQGTRLNAGVALTTPAFEFADTNPLSLVGVGRDLGGLADQVDLLVASAGLGGMIESAAPPERFARTLDASVAALSKLVRAGDQLPKGWWGVMDAPLLPRQLSRVSVQASPPALKLRYRRRPLMPLAGGTAAGRADMRSRIRESPLGKLFEPIRPFDEFRPGGPLRSVLGAVGAAGFEYAMTKAEFGAPPTIVTGVEGLTVLNYTAGRWDGWTPFETINDMGDVDRAERRLLRGGRPGWLVGGIDACLWTFSGHILDRGRELREICMRLARGGASGRLINVTPRTAARYARLLGERGLVRTVGVS
jgi:hypothetical protein